ncbi:hypothetical protein N6L24_11235 [Cognatishimia sp. SS12]|uniref:hypothetical protein n=1 Tax=Cognatishimia sp. SS12 TaxID=2979465 RepID=UPI002330421E|nr:hypothetical protein [Cognatishimia sp. SS12]MDC0738852.1 hypothetical protein [Cognatishimia sp. SS12]
MTALQPRYVTEGQQPQLLFTVCTLVASEDKYARMLASFEAKGFTAENSEFIAVDNRSGNSLDGYRALRSLFPEMRGEFILFTHDDIELTDDGADELEQALRSLEASDKTWMVAGNAGWTPGPQAEQVICLDDPHGSWTDLKVAREVVSLDENFLVLARNRMVFPSLDLDGFHLFATDLCQQARAAGGTAYVLPFHLTHHSGGAGSTAYDQSRAAFEGKYAALRLDGRLRTPASTLYIGARGQMQKQWDKAEIAFTSKLNAAVRKTAAFARTAAGNSGN